MPSRVASTRSAATGHELAVRALDLSRAVDRGRAAHQVGRSRQVARAARMDDQPRPRQSLHEQSRAAGMVEVDVGRDDVVDGIRRQPARARARQAGAAPSGSCRCRRTRRDRARRSGRRRRTAAGESRCRRRRCRDRARATNSGEAGRWERHASEEEVAIDSRERAASGETGARSRIAHRCRSAVRKVTSCTHSIAHSRALPRCCCSPRSAPARRSRAACPSARRSTRRAIAFGGPSCEYPAGRTAARGSNSVEYAQTYMLDFDAAGRLVSTHQVLTPDELRGHQAGHDAAPTCWRGSADPRRRVPGRLAEAAGRGTTASAAWRATASSSRCRSATSRTPSPTPDRTPIRSARAAVTAATNPSDYRRETARAASACVAACRGSASLRYAARSCLSTNGRMPPCR